MQPEAGEREHGEDAVNEEEARGFHTVEMVTVGLAEANRKSWNFTDGGGGLAAADAGK